MAADLTIMSKYPLFMPPDCILSTQNVDVVETFTFIDGVLVT